MSEYGHVLLTQLDADDLAELRRLLALTEPLASTRPHAETFLTAAEAAERVGVCVETIRRAVRSGALKGARAGRAVRIDPGELMAWLSRLEDPVARQPLGRRDRPRSVMKDAMRHAA